MRRLVANRFVFYCGIVGIVAGVELGPDWFPPPAGSSFFIACLYWVVNFVPLALLGRAPCKGVGFQWVRIPPGNLVIHAGSSSIDSGGNERVGASSEKGSFWRLSERFGP